MIQDLYHHIMTCINDFPSYVILTYQHLFQPQWGIISHFFLAFSSFLPLPNKEHAILKLILFTVIMYAQLIAVNVQVRHIKLAKLRVLT